MWVTIISFAASVHINMGNHTQTVCFFLEASGLSLGRGGKGRLQGSKRTLRRCLEGIDLKLEQGQLALLLGPNGAGKSTLLNALAGRLLTEAGEIVLQQQDLDKGSSPLVAQSRQSDNSKRWNRQVGYMPEAIPLLPRLTVRETLENALYLKTGRMQGDAVTRAIGLCDLAAFANKPVETLSLGYRQRLGLACALVHEPLVLLLDEPMNGLDPEHAQAFGQILAGLKPRHIIVLSTHLLDPLHGLADRIFVMRGGRLLGDLRTDEPRPVLPHTAALEVESPLKGDDSLLKPWRLRFDRPLTPAVKERVAALCPILQEEPRAVVVNSNQQRNRQLIESLAGEGLWALSPCDAEGHQKNNAGPVASLLTAYQELLQRDVVARSADMENNDPALNVTLKNPVFRKGGGEQDPGRLVK